MRSAMMVLCFGLVGLSDFWGCGTEPAAVQFVDVTTASGISFIHTNGAAGDYFMIETYGSGCCFIDYDQDGDLDVYLINGFDLKDIKVVPVNLAFQRGNQFWVKKAERYTGSLSRDPESYTIELPVPAASRSTNVLYRNDGDGTFTDVTLEAGVGDTRYGMGCAVADYDNDGDPDLYVTNYGPNVLYRNNRDGTFTDVTVLAGVEAPQWSTSAIFFDYDSDGYLDLYVVNYVDFTMANNKVCGGYMRTNPQGYRAIYKETRSYCAPQDYEGVPDVLYRNNRDGTFADVSLVARVADPYGKGLGAVAWDFDDDGDQDVFVANDGVANFLYQNKGNGIFDNVALSRGAAFNGEGDDEACMGVDFGDYDNDGDFDLFFVNFSYETHTLLRNDGGFFKDVTVEAGLGEISWRFLGFGTNFVDYDNDGDLDLYVANGHVLDKAPLFQPESEYRQPHHLFQNDGAGHFTEVSADAGAWFARKQVSRGAAFGDYDNDGDVDVLVANCGGEAKLVRNEGGNQRHWLQVRAVGKRSNRDGVGARVKVVAGDLVQLRQVRSGSSYLAAHDSRLHFGLGSRNQVDLIEVRWPSGIVQRIEKIPVNQVLVVEEPDRP